MRMLVTTPRDDLDQRDCVDLVPQDKLVRIEGFEHRVDVLVGHLAIVRKRIRADF